MPELPEVETIKRQLGEKLVSRKWQGKTIVGVRRRAKLLIIDFKDNSSLVFHLKLTGQLIFFDKKCPKPGKHTRQVFCLGDNSCLFFNDMRKFGWFKHTQNADEMEEMKGLGPEPFTVNFKDFKSLLAKRKRSKIKPLLLDQKFIAGIGNIYADEILFASKVLPTRQVSGLTDKEITSIYQNMNRILKAAIKAGGSSNQNYLDATGQKGHYQNKQKVYRKTNQPCPVCNTPIKRIILASRGTHFCPKCQK